MCFSDRAAADAYVGPADAARQQAATFTVHRERLLGWRADVQAAGLPWDAVPVEECGGTTVQDGRHGLRRLFGRAPTLTAVLAMTDQLAMGACAEARALGRRVPRISRWSGSTTSRLPPTTSRR